MPDQLTAHVSALAGSELETDGLAAPMGVTAAVFMVCLVVIGLAGWLGGMLCTFALVRAKGRRAVVALAREARDVQDRELDRWSRRGGRIVPFRRVERGPYAGGGA